MLIYRVEHSRTECSTGKAHGPAMGRVCASEPPLFGKNGAAPTLIESHELCAVTRDQYPRWWAPDIKPGPWVMPHGWEVIAYAVNDGGDHDDEWHIDNNQIVFNPEYANRIGPVDHIRLRELVSA